MNRRQQIIYNSCGQCFYCGALLSEQTRYQPDSLCINLYVPRRWGGSKTPQNQVAACYSCCYIKKDMDTRKLSVEQVRQQLNEERRRLGLPYNKLYCTSEQQTQAQAQAQQQVIEVLPQTQATIAPAPGNEEEQEDEQHQEWLKQALSQLQLDQGQNI